MTPERCIRELKGDLPDELIAIGLWLDQLGAERRLPRNPGESDQSYRDRIIADRLNEHITTSIVSLLRLDRRS